MPLDAENVKASPSTSVADSSRVSDVSSSMAWLAIDVITGASLTGSTVKLKLPESLLCPSLTVIVTKIEPW